MVSTLRRYDSGVSAAENGLVPYQAIRSAHGQLKQLGVMHCARVDPAPASESSSRTSGGDGGDGGDGGEATPWELFASADLRVAAQKAAAGLQRDGAAVVDGVLKPRLAAAVARALARYAAESRDAFKARGGNFCSSRVSPSLIRFISYHHAFKL